MKIAVSGKGGVGKTFIAGTLAAPFVRSGHRVIALDADPSPNLAQTLVHVVENGTKIEIAINPVVCQIKALKTKNTVYNISKGKHSMIHLICIGDFYRAPIPQTFSYFIRKIMLIYENYKELSPVFWKNYNTRLFFKC